METMNRRDKYISDAFTSSKIVTIPTKSAQENNTHAMNAKNRQTDTITFNNVVKTECT